MPAVPKIKYPESDSRQGILMFTVLFAGFVLASEIPDPIGREAVAFGTYLGFIAITIIRQVMIEKEAGTMRHAEDTYYTADGIPHREELFIRRIVWKGIVQSRAREFWLYEYFVEKHEELPMKSLLGDDCHRIERHIRILPERIDKFHDFLPREKVARWKGEGPFNHGASDVMVSILAPLPHPEAGLNVPVHFDVWGSRLYAKIMAGWDEAIKELSATDVEKIVAELTQHEGHEVYPSKIADRAVKSYLRPGVEEEPLLPSPGQRKKK